MAACVAAMAISCGDTVDSECIPREVLVCACDDGADGRAVCEEDGEPGPCECEQGPLLDEVSATVGTFCGPGDEMEEWLTISDQPLSCREGGNLARDGQGTGMYLRVSDRASRVGADSYEATVRRCRRGACEDYTAEIELIDYAPDDGAEGTFAMVLSDGSREEGHFVAEWCNYDALLEPRLPERLARGVRVADVDVYQGTRVRLVQDGAAVVDRAAPVIAGRPGILRIGLSADPEWEPRPIRVRVTFRYPGGETTVVEQQLGQILVPAVDDPLSTINFDLAQASLVEGTEFTVELLETEPCLNAPGSDTGARWPVRGRDTLGVGDPGPLRVVLVPIIYAGDGSMRTPSLTSQLLLDMRDQLFAYFPVPDVELSTRAAVTFDSVIEPGCDMGAPCAWDDLLGALVALRVDDGVDGDVFYYGIVNPGPTIEDYCNGSCILGLGVETGPRDSLFHAAAGIGFTANPLARAATLDTLTHELGHTLGRRHAPCGNPENIDPDFPYAGGIIGSWGYDVRDESYYEPSLHSDIMGYCANPWISDYNFGGIGRRLVNQRAISLEGALRPSARVASWIGQPGGARSMPQLPAADLEGGSHAEHLEATVLDAQGSRVASTEVRVLRIPDTGGRILLSPEAQPGWASLRLADGTELSLQGSPGGPRLLP